MYIAVGVLFGSITADESSESFFFQVVCKLCLLSLWVHDGSLVQARMTCMCSQNPRHPSRAERIHFLYFNLFAVRLLVSGAIIKQCPDAAKQRPDVE